MNNIDLASVLREQAEVLKGGAERKINMLMSNDVFSDYDFYKKLFVQPKNKFNSYLGKKYDDDEDCSSVKTDVAQDKLKRVKERIAALRGCPLPGDYLF